MNWYALFVKTGQEDKVKQRLQYRFGDRLTFFVPKRKLRERKAGQWRFVSRTLFPGYVLIKGILDRELTIMFIGIPGVLKLLKSGTEPLPIDKKEIEVLGRLICNGETIGFSTALIKNDKVLITDGPLTSMEGFISAIDGRKGRAKIRLNFLGEERTVELGIDVLKPSDQQIH